MPASPIVAPTDSDNVNWNRQTHKNLVNQDDAIDMMIEGEDTLAEIQQEQYATKMRVISGESGNFIPVPNLCTPDYCIKIGLTLYKVQQNIYLLDFQKMTGDAFSFMTLCANIITELKTLSAASKQQQALLAQAQAQHQAALQQQAAVSAGQSGIPVGSGSQRHGSMPTHK